MPEAKSEDAPEYWYAHTGSSSGMQTPEVETDLGESCEGGSYANKTWESEGYGSDSSTDSDSSVPGLQFSKTLTLPAKLEGWTWDPIFSDDDEEAVNGSSPRSQKSRQETQAFRDRCKTVGSVPNLPPAILVSAPEGIKAEIRV